MPARTDNQRLSPNKLISIGRKHISRAKNYFTGLTASHFIAFGNFDSTSGISYPRPR